MVEGWVGNNNWPISTRRGKWREDDDRRVMELWKCLSEIIMVNIINVRTLEEMMEVGRSEDGVQVHCSGWMNH